MGSESKLKVIKCSLCGEQILLLPDVKGMDRAIENHAKKHERKEIDPRKAKLTYDRVQNDLVGQALFLAGKTKIPDSSSKRLANGS